MLVANSKKTQGIGVPESILRRVFEPIRQLGKSTGQAWDLHRSLSSRN
jgi:signal transduction histidine kinase